MSRDAASKTLCLIDGHAQFFRAYYAIRSGLTSPVTHEPTHLVYSFAAMLLKMLREHPPDYLAVVIDVSGDRESFRSQLYPEYKANREKAPDDFHPQVERCLELLEKLAIPVLGEAGVEADDVLATLARRMEREHDNLKIQIVSRDKDLTQLIDDRIELFDAHKDEVVSPADIFKTEGVEPQHVIDVLALMGDNVDNVPGVPGIGPKTAAKLILEHGSIENLLANIGQIKGKRRENIEASRDILELSKQLVTLRDDVEVGFDLEAAAYDPYQFDVEGAIALFKQLGLNRQQDDLRALVRGESGDDPEPLLSSAIGSAPAPTARELPIGESLFDMGEAAPAGPSDPGEYTCITTEEELTALIERIHEVGQCAIDTETDHLDARRAELCGISIATQPRAAVYIPVRSPEPDSHMDVEAVLGHLKPVLEDNSVTKVGHNLKYDINVLRRSGVELHGRLFDTMIASYVIDASRSSHSLNVLSLALLKHTCTPISDLIGSGKKQKPFDEVPLERAAPYAAEDADMALRLMDVMWPDLEARQLDRLFDDVEMPLVRVLAEMEWNGIRVDPDELDRQRERLQERIGELRDRILDEAPHPFNPDSPKQLAAALFNASTTEPPGLGLRPLKRGKTGPSTDIEVLEKIAADPDIDTPVPRLIVEYRQLTKLVNTYLLALKEAINPETKRVHASFNQTVAATGRLSSSDPNLQNIPIRTEVGREIRRAFVAEPGHVLITADYSQIELRILAHLSEDPALIEAFERGHDIHTAVAAQVYGVAEADVTPTQRDSAKMVNFGIVYGITPFGLARRLGPGTSKEEAGAIIADYKRRFGRIRAFLDQCIATAETEGYVETMLGRRRAIPQIISRQPQQRALGERMAINSVVQGSAADLIKLAMIDLNECIPKQSPDARMVLQIHDELVFETPEDGAAEAQAFIVRRMQQAMDLRVPLVVEAARSTSWIDAK